MTYQFREAGTGEGRKEKMKGKKKKTQMKLKKPSECIKLHVVGGRAKLLHLLRGENVDGDKVNLDIKNCNVDTNRGAQLSGE